MNSAAAEADALAKYAALQSRYEQLEIMLQHVKHEAADANAARRVVDASSVYERQHSEQSARQLVSSC